MRQVIVISIVTVLCVAGTGWSGRDTLVVSDARQLQAIFTEPVYNKVIRLAAGVYDLTPTVAVDSTCGNCQDPDTTVSITVGIRISGEQVSIVGPGDSAAVIVTHAGYGLFFHHCRDCAIENLSITGGERDADGNATDAAIVVKDGTVLIENNLIHDNIGDSAIVTQNVVGVMGICGREDSEITIRNNRIIRNSWDGIALYRNARAIIVDNVIDGVDKAGGSRAAGGRGVAIGITWNARAYVEHNLVKRYWKGIGLFVDAKATVRANIIEDMLTWGIALWDADKGKPVGVIEGNVIYNVGACGASITSSTDDCYPGRFTDNVIVRTGWDERYDSPDYYCYQCALAEHAVPDGFAISGNIFFDNRRATDDLPDYDVPEEDFVKELILIYRDLFIYDIFQESDFYQEFCIKK